MTRMFSMCVHKYFRKYFQLRCKGIYCSWQRNYFGIEGSSPSCSDDLLCGLLSAFLIFFRPNHRWWDARNRHSIEQLLLGEKKYFWKLIFYDIISANEAPLIVSFRRKNIFCWIFNFFSLFLSHRAEPIQVRRTDDWLFHGFHFFTPCPENAEHTWKH